VARTEPPATDGVGPKSSGTHTPPGAAAVPARTGDRLGRFTLADVLGHGGMATVYRAHDDTLDRDVAIKVLSPQIASRSDGAERFRREALAVAAIRHAGIVDVHEFVPASDNQCAYLVEELIAGPTLQDIIDARQASPTPVVAGAYNGLATCYVSKDSPSPEEWNKALFAFLQAIDIQPDFSQVYLAARATAAGDEVYYRVDLERWRRKWSSTYPPIAHWLYVPVSQLRFRTALVLHNLLGIALLLGTGGLLLRAAGCLRARYPRAGRTGARAWPRPPASRARWNAPRWSAPGSPKGSSSGSRAADARCASR